LVEAFYPRAFCKILRGLEDPLLDQVRLDVVRHGERQASDVTAALNGKRAAVPL
jgi:hypothetical protein